MLGSISLLGERARSRKWGLTTGALALGAAAAGAVLGATLGSIGGFLPLSAGLATNVMIACLALAAVVDLLWLPRRIGPIRQVNDQWLMAYRGWVAGAGFGIELGFAVATVVTSATTYVALAAMVFVGSPGAAAVIGVAYGTTRGLTVMFGAAIRTSAQLARADALLVRTDAGARYAVAAATAGLPIIVLFTKGV